MGYGNIVIQLMLVYYIKYLIWLIFVPSNRKIIIKTNTKLETMRKTNFKTLEEQKKFLDLKYPKSSGFKFHWKMIPTFILHAGIFIGLMFLVRMPFIYYNIDIPMWIGIIFIITFPIIFNIIAKKFNLQKGTDLSVFLK